MEKLNGKLVLCRGVALLSDWDNHQYGSQMNTQERRIVDELIHFALAALLAARAGMVLGDEYANELERAIASARSR